jgi:hypothetical protein
MLVEPGTIPMIVERATSEEKSRLILPSSHLPLPLQIQSVSQSDTEEIHRVPSQ